MNQNRNNVSWKVDHLQWNINYHDGCPIVCGIQSTNILSLWSGNCIQSAGDMEQNTIVLIRHMPSGLLNQNILIRVRLIC